MVLISVALLCGNVWAGKYRPRIECSVLHVGGRGNQMPCDGYPHIEQKEVDVQAISIDKRLDSLEQRIETVEKRQESQVKILIEGLNEIERIARK